MPVINPWKSYHQTATLTAPPGQIVLMLYDGAIRFLERALNGFACSDPAELNMTVHNNLQRASDVIRELDFALDLERGGELASTLHRLYEYFQRRILASNIRKERLGIQEVLQHLNVLRDAWSAMLKGDGPSAQDTAIPQSLSAALCEWRRLADAVGKGIRAGDWSFVAECQRAIAQLRPTVDRFTGRPPVVASQNATGGPAKTTSRALVLDLIQLEQKNLSSIQQRREKLSAHIEDLLRANRNLREIRRSYAFPAPPALNSFS
jgi:flagellar protein FliS